MENIPGQRPVSLSKGRDIRQIRISKSSNMDMAIRRAVKEDCPRLLELVHELEAYERAPQEVTVTLDHFVSSGFGEKPVWWAFVAESGTRLVGFALYYIPYSTWKGTAMYLEDI